MNRPRLAHLNLSVAKIAALIIAGDASSLSGDSVGVQLLVRPVVDIHAHVSTRCSAGNRNS